MALTTTSTQAFLCEAARRQWSEMKYHELVDRYADDTQHIHALMSARCVAEDDEVDEAFLDVLGEEGYEVV